MQRIINVSLVCGLLLSLGVTLLVPRGRQEPVTPLRPNALLAYNATVDEPRIGAGSYVDPLASVIGDVRLGRRTLVLPFASVRADAGWPIRIGSRSSVQDGAIIQAAAPSERGAPATIEYNGRVYAVYIGDDVSLSAQAQIHGPAKVGDRTYVGPRALIYRSEIGENSVIEPGALVVGVKVPAGRYVAVGASVTTQQQADALPPITATYRQRTINDDTVRLSLALLDGYLGLGRADAQAEPAVSGQGAGATSANEATVGEGKVEPKGATGAKPAAPFPAAPAASGASTPAAGH